MKPWSATFEGRRKIADTTYEITCKITGSGFKFAAGQYIRLILPRVKSGNVTDTYHDFSLSSSPGQLPSITTAYRQSKSIYKTALGKLQPGDPVIVEGPDGVFTPSANDKKFIGLAGGIGVAPFVSMARWLDQSGSEQIMELSLFNRNREAAAYMDELAAIAGHNKNFHLSSHYGPVDGPSLARLIDKHNEERWYIAGPPGMVRSARQLLNTSGILEENIITEEFTGYE